MSLENFVTSGHNKLLGPPVTKILYDFKFVGSPRSQKAAQVDGCPKGQNIIILFYSVKTTKAVKIKDR